MFCLEVPSTLLPAACTTSYSYTQNATASSSNTSQQQQRNNVNASPSSTSTSNEQQKMLLEDVDHQATSAHQQPSTPQQQQQSAPRVFTSRDLFRFFKQRASRSSQVLPTGAFQTEREFLSQKFKQVSEASGTRRFQNFSSA